MTETIGTFAIEVSGYDVPVTVDSRGMFVAEHKGETIEADSLVHLRNAVADLILSSRAEVPFVSRAGRRGVMRGFHAANKDILVTYEDGQKGRLSGHDRVFAELDEETRSELLSLLGQRQMLDERIGAIHADTVYAKDVFTEAMAEDFFDWARHREAVA